MVHRCRSVCSQRNGADPVAMAEVKLAYSCGGTLISRCGVVNAGPGQSAPGATIAARGPGGWSASQAPIAGVSMLGKYCTARSHRMAFASARAVGRTATTTRLFTTTPDPPTAPSSLLTVIAYTEQTSLVPNVRHAHGMGREHRRVCSSSVWRVVSGQRTVVICSRLTYIGLRLACVVGCRVLPVERTPAVGGCAIDL